jgi:hypothetical protein
MMRPRLVVLLAILCLSVRGADASACLNDRATGNAEREFKSSYRDTTPLPSTSPPSGNNVLVASAMAGVGVVFLAAVGITTVRWRRQRPPTEPPRPG